MPAGNPDAYSVPAKKRLAVPATGHSKMLQQAARKRLSAMQKKSLPKRPTPA